MIKSQKMNVFISLSVSFIYCCISYKFYMTEYYVPDFSLYSSFGKMVSKDGFSSMFCYLSSYINIYPKTLTILSLFLISSSIAIIIYNVLILKINNFYKIVFNIFFLSSSFLFYYTGKLFYEFPFYFFVYSLAFHFALIIQKKENDIYLQRNKYFMIFFLLLGFTLSWKPFSIFSVAGLILIIFTLNKSLIVISKRYKFLFLISFILGYIIGNYHLIDKPIDTLNGLKGYSAQGSIYSHFFEHKIAWDNVNILSFDYSNIKVISAILILFVLPLFLKEFKLLFVSIFISVNYLIFIKFFSPGYSWHGFSMSIFIVTIFYFLLIRISTTKLNNTNKIYINFILVFTVSIQCYHNWFIYIPKQNLNFEQTNKGIELIHKNKNAIGEYVKEIEKEFNIKILPDIEIKRFKVENKKFLNSMEENADGFLILPEQKICVRIIPMVNYDYDYFLNPRYNNKIIKIREYKINNEVLIEVYKNE